MVIATRNASYVKDAISLLRGNLPGTWRAEDDPHDVERWRDLGGWQGGVLHQFNQASLTRLLNLYGFVVEEWQPFGRWAKHLGRSQRLCSGIALRARRVD